MRQVIIEGSPPQEWIDQAEEITRQLREAGSPEARRAILDENEGFWRNDILRDWLLKQFHDKCWYTEANESVSPLHVDHFRPQKRVSDLDKNRSEGYWWLAFQWENYRISGHLINTKKGDCFPIIEGARANCDDPVSLTHEAGLLIDPITQDANLISYERDDGDCIAVPSAGADEVDTHRAQKTIEIIGLNRIPRLNKKRRKFWDQCLSQIQNYQSASTAASQYTKRIYQELALTSLKGMVTYDKEFSSIAKACIRKNAPEPLAASVLEAG